MQETHRSLKISIDRGGTFLDIWANWPGRDHPLVTKILSVNPKAYSDAPTEAIRRVLSEFRGEEIPRGQILDLGDVESIRMGTTVATNALLERKGEPVAFMVTKGFKDLLIIGDQSRPDLFDLQIRRSLPLPSLTVEVDERVILASSYPIARPIIECEGMDTIQVEKSVDVEAVRKQLQDILAQGYRSLALALMHSYIYPAHERLIADLAHDIGFENVSLSSDIAQMIKIVSRGHSATADAYLTPELQRQLKGLVRNFTNVRPGLFQMMQSDGGLVSAERFSGLKAILSGPAGGVCGFASTCYDADEGRAVIGFDVGGTSTDVSRFSGDFEHVLETTTAGIKIQTPTLDINTVAAGGGSCLKWENGMFAAGPESAGANPGPCCYRKGGPLTVTDANLLLGRIVPETFPKVFGPNEDEGLDVEAVATAFAALAKQIAHDTGRSWTSEEVAQGFIDIATENMSEPVRALTEMKGHLLRDHNLAVFGGAGGQLACGVAETLEIDTVLIHRFSSILSAYGIAIADVVQDEVETFAICFEKSSLSAIQDKVEQVRQKAIERLLSDAPSFDSVEVQVFLTMRNDGTDTSLMIRQPVLEDNTPSWDFLPAFQAQHQKEFGFTLAHRSVLVQEVRVRAIGKAKVKTPSKGLMKAARTTFKNAKASLEGHQSAKVYFASTGWTPSKLVMLEQLDAATSHIEGPCVLLDKTQTVIVAPGFSAALLPEHIVLQRSGQSRISDSPVAKAASFDPTSSLALSVMAKKFMNIAERMGHVLQRTSVSVNIKERLDFSCSIFSNEGNMVANAPHVPAMLGSMAFAVKYQASLWKGRLRPGDVLLSNHPIAGGVHLPDMTIVAPVFSEDGKEIIFFVASRGHHADVGSITPGSMPPNSKFLAEEGAPIESFKIVEAGVFQEAGLVKLLVQDVEAAGYPSTRTLSDNISDLKAQIAACHKGIGLLNQLVLTYGLNNVQQLMSGIQRMAEKAVRNLLIEFGASRDFKPVKAIDYMDDGTPIALSITVSKNGEAVFDFTGTGSQVLGNWNAPTAICYSSVIYCLRSMLGSDIPLNQGCLDPIRLIIPPQSLLAPTREVAVCAGNVLTSQRITDTILRAFEAQAASCGCMGNLTFGYDDPDGSTMGFYETIAGGTGAGPTWHGTSAVQSNMTNTRMGDPEVMEKRYPLFIRQFGIREGSGGAGRYQGGNGAIREIEFRRSVTCSILSERRARAPWGLAGGEDAAPGKNIWRRWDEATQTYLPDLNLGGKNSARMGRGDRMVVMTPGGGGWGPVQRPPVSTDIEMLPEQTPLHGSTWARKNGKLPLTADLPAWTGIGGGSLAERIATQAASA